MSPRSIARRTSPFVGLVFVATLASIRPAGTLAQAEGPTLDKPLFTMAELGPPPGTLNVPFGLAAAPDGSIYVADTGNDRIQQVAPDGRVLQLWGSQGAGPTQFSGPTDVAVGADGSVYVADTGNSRVSRFGPDGTLLGQWQGGPDAESALRLPYGLTVAPDGTLWVADSYRHRLQHFSATGTWLGMWGRMGTAEGELQEPSAVAVSADGRVYVVDRANNRVQQFSAAGDFVRAWGGAGAAPGQFNQPWDLALHPDGTLFVTDRLNQRVQHFGADGAFLGSFGKAGVGEGEFGLPTGIAVAPDGSLLLTDMDNARLQRLDPEGGFRWQWGAKAPRPPSLQALAAGPDGSVYLLDGTLGAIWRLAADGRLLGRWGAPGSEDGAFRFGTGAKLLTGPDGRVHVLDDGNRRVQTFSAEGTYLGQWSVAPPDGGTAPVGFARDPDGSFLIGDSGTNHVHRFGPNGAPLAEWGGKGNVRGRTYGIQDLALAPDGSLVYLLDPVTSQIQVFDPLGAALRVLGSGWDGSCRGWASSEAIRFSLVVAPDGSLYGSSQTELLHWRPDGTELGRWGASGPWLGRVGQVRGLAMAGPNRLLATSLGAGRPRLTVFGAAYGASWRAEFFSDRWLSGWPAAVAELPEPALDPGLAPPAAGLPADGWSARFSRVIPLAAGEHRFGVRAKGGARLWLDDAVLLDRWNAAAVDEAVLARLPEGAYALRLELNDPGGAASIALALETVDAVGPSATPSPTAGPTETPYPFPSATPLPSYTPNPRTTPWPTAFPNRLCLPWIAAQANPPTAPTASPEPLPFAAIPDIDVLDYAVTLTVPDLVAADIEAHAAVTVQVLAPMDSIDLHVEPEALKVRAVSVGGRAISHRVVAGRPNAYGLTGARLRSWPRRPLAAGDTVVLDIDYRLDAAAFSGIRGFMARQVDGAPFLFTRGLPYYNRYWLPGNDHPSDAATASFDLRVPADMVAAANGLLEGGDYRMGSGIDDQGLRRFVWRQGVPIPVYLMAVAIGPFKVHQEEVCFNPGPDGGTRVDCGGSPEQRLPLVWYYPGTGTGGFEARTLVAIENAADAVARFSGLLGPYPFEKLGYVSVPLPYSSEYASLIAVNYPNGDRDILHETVHSWWGDAVRIPHWGDFWIKEGLTNYFSGYWDELNRDLFGNGAILVNPCDPSTMRGGPDLEPMDAFITDMRVRRSNAAPYTRGAATVHDLRHRIAALMHTDIWDPRAKLVWEALLRGLYTAHLGQTLSTEQLEAYVRANLGWRLAAAGFDVPPAELTAILDGWAWRWLQGGEKGAGGGPR